MKPPTHTESTFFQLIELNPLFRPFIDPNCTKSKSDSGNDDIRNRVDIGDGVDIDNKVDDKVSYTNGYPLSI